MLDISEVLRAVAFTCWFMFLIWTLLGVVSLRYKPKRASEPAKNVNIVIVSIANSKVRNSLFETIENVRSFGLKYYLVVDEGAELIKELPSEHLIIVPKKYKEYLIAKGRAINYFVENYVQNDCWYGFVDDDNILQDTEFLYEIPYYEKQGYAAMNPVLVMRKGKSSLTYIMDSIRLFDDLTVYRFFTGLIGKPLVGLHGELLCVKGDVLKEIGFDHRTITEDFHFSIELLRRNYKTWQSKTKMSLKSPNSLHDLMRQRGRWFKGIALELQNANSLMKIVVGSRMTFWALGIFGSWAFVFLWPTWGPMWLALPGGIAYWLLYGYGVLRASKWWFITFIPLIGIIESLSWVFSFKQKGFVVIDKC